jgi:hypothetical protein
MVPAPAAVVVDVCWIADEVSMDSCDGLPGSLADRPSGEGSGTGNTAGDGTPSGDLFTLACQLADPLSAGVFASAALGGLAAGRGSVRFHAFRLTWCHTRCTHACGRRVPPGGWVVVTLVDDHRAEEIRLHDRQHETTHHRRHPLSQRNRDCTYGRMNRG